MLSSRFRELFREDFPPFFTIFILSLNSSYFIQHILLCRFIRLLLSRHLNYKAFHSTSYQLGHLTHKEGIHMLIIYRMPGLDYHEK